MFWLLAQLENAYQLTATLGSSWTCCLMALCIVGYQRYLSPYKGFSCAHRVLHQRHSCSEYAKRAIQREGVLRAVPLVRRRFNACALASAQLQQDREERAKRQTGLDCEPCDASCCDLGTQIACASPDLLGSVDCAHLGACDACTHLGACTPIDACACVWP